MNNAMLKCSQVVLLLSSASMANATAILSSSAIVYMLDGTGTEIAREESFENNAVASVSSTANQSSATAKAFSSYTTLIVDSNTSSTNRGDLVDRPATANASAYASDTLYFSQVVPILHMEYVFFIKSAIDRITVGGIRLDGTGCCEQSPADIPINSDVMEWSALLTANATAHSAPGYTRDVKYATAILRSLTLMDANGVPLTGMTYSSDSGTQYNILNATSTVPEPASWLLLVGGLSCGALLKGRSLWSSRRCS